MHQTTHLRSCLNRRQWLGVAAGAGALSASSAWGAEQSAAAKPATASALIRELSPEEKAAAQSSRLVAKALQLRHQAGHNCAECILAAVVQCYELPPKTADAAAAFGGGVGQGELCGFLTGGSMAFGALAGKTDGDRAAVKKRVKKWNDAWWTWWRGWAPLDCRDLKPQYDKAGFDNLLTRACLKFEEIAGIG